mmetsp:Transcript_17779/g.58474  ORF Transcript_17779/g.58474 Transcript_17779/m.58474 type:complete len:139 (-) Transcript_17779:227-643(-)
MSLAVFFIYGTSAGLSRVIMLTVPMQTRPFALALQTLGLHLFGDVPSPVIIGAVKDSLAPHCGIVFGNDTASGCGGADLGHLNPQCAASPEDVRGLHLTIWIAVLWSIWAVVLWAAAFGLLLRRARRIGEGAAASGSG